MERDEERSLLCQMLSSTAAQMRGSMGNIHAALRRMAAQVPRDGDEKYAAILTQSYYRLLRLIDNMSDAPLLAGEGMIRGPERDIVSWLENLIHQAQPLAKEQGLELTFCSAKPYHTVAIHEGLMERLVWNLLSNAIKFTPAGGRIDVSLDFHDGQVVMAVADNGCGISEEMMDSVYERYLHPERTDPPPHGLGLGLPLCRRIAEGHGGRLLLTTRKGEGTTATVSLPDIHSGETIESPALPCDGGFQRVLVGLSDALGYRVFFRKNLDE